jgi:hypothetical protein
MILDALRISAALEALLIKIKMVYQEEDYLVNLLYKYQEQ